MHERTLAVIALLVVVPSAGCLGVVDSATSPTGTPPVETVAACAGDLERLDADGTNGSLPDRNAGFAIDVTRTTVSRGGELQITLENVADEPRGTGPSRMFVLQRHVGDEWRTVLGTPTGRAGWNATLLIHEPGEGFTWNLTASVSGFSTRGYEVCGALPADEYRFVYFGLVETGTDGRLDSPAGDTFVGPSVAVRFRLVE
ncbi:MAG: hypothetical protein ABEJ47_02535 [Halorhabdus sp.]